MGAPGETSRLDEDAAAALGPGATHTENTTEPPTELVAVDPNGTEPEPSPRPRTTLKARLLPRIEHQHGRIPYLSVVPLRALGIIILIALVDVAVWIVMAIVLSFHARSLFSTAALAYTLGLRHALDADHISAIDLMTRRLIASGQRPVTVGTWFSLGHSTIVVITSILVAATASSISTKFSAFGTIGGIIGSAISASFLLLLGLMNFYILYRLIVQLRKAIYTPASAWEVTGGGPLFRFLKRMFKLIDHPWKMYPVGVVFGLGFDTSSEIALLGISSIQAAKGTSIWLILIFPLLFTAGMCLIDTIDGALMLTLYVAPMDRFAGGKVSIGNETVGFEDDGAEQTAASSPTAPPPSDGSVVNSRARDPIAFLYYSTVLTALTVTVALIIGTIQLLTLVLNVATPTGRFWDGVATAGNNYEIIGGSICGSFVVFGGLSVLCYKPWRRKYVDRKRAEQATAREEVGFRDEEAEEVGFEAEEAEAELTEVGKGSEGSAGHGTDDRHIKETGGKQKDRVDIEETNARY